MRYRAEPDRLDATARWMAGLGSGWQRRRAAITSLAEAAGDAPEPEVRT